VSDTPDVDDQLSSLTTLTAGGLFLALLGAILILSDHYQSFAGELRACRAAQARVAEVLPEAPIRPDHPKGPNSARAVVTTSAGPGR
jgi:hypothetical protein